MNKSTFVKIAFGVCLTASSASFASNSDLYLSRPDGHAPIGVMRDHIHKKGEFMLSYRYDLMNMNKMQDGTKNLSNAAALNDYMMVPTKMNMKMHMAMVMYGITDKLTVMVMSNYVTNSMKMVDMDGAKTSANISGFGDSSITGMYEFFKDANSHAQFNFGLLIPSGNIKRNDNGSRAAYAMQLGSGSYAFLPGFSYSGFQESYSYGAQVNGQFRINNNSLKYKLGDSYNLTAWGAKKLNEAFSLSSRLNYSITQKTKGFDSALNSEDALMMSPTNNALFSGGRKLDLLFGVNFIVPNGALKGHRLGVEAGVPLYQKYSGIQMKSNYNITLGWQKSF